MPPNHVVLALDTSAAHCAVALLCDGKILAEKTEQMTKGQAERLFPLINEVLADQDLAMADISRIGVCVGPGNFTGIRVSVSAARGLALGLKVPAIGVSRLHAMAFGTRGEVTCLLDARQGRAYQQRFRDSMPLSEPDLATPAATFTGPIVIDPAEADVFAALDQPAFPAFNVVVATAHLAAAQTGSDHPRPAPLYLRPANAAPSADPPPVILP